MNLLDIALDFIFPPACGICGKIGKGYICDRCYKEIEIYLYHNSEIKRNNIFYLLQYKDIIRKKMIDYKFNHKPYLHQMFYEILIKNKKACEFLKNYDIIIPVPIHKKKWKTRGYNQSELIARKIAKNFHIPIDTKILLKTKNTPMQSSLGKEDRIKNVQSAYKVENQEKIKDKNVLLVDDIYTTGATVKECKRMLQLTGAKKVGIMIIAKD